MMCRDGVMMGYVSILASDDHDGWLTSQPPWLSVPLTVDFSLRLDIYKNNSFHISFNHSSHSFY